MPAKQADLDSLWKSVESARLRWKSTLDNVREVNGDRAGIPSPDGSYANLTALRAERLALEEYHRAVRDLNAALAAENEPAPEEPLSEVEDTTRITPREREVLSLIAAGRSSKEIAAELGMAFRTAVCHRYRIYRKLNVHSSVELTRAALRMGLVEPVEPLSKRGRSAENH